jgi:hypothetical protein
MTVLEQLPISHQMDILTSLPIQTPQIVQSPHALLEQTEIVVPITPLQTLIWILRIHTKFMEVQML